MYSSFFLAITASLIIQKILEIGSDNYLKSINAVILTVVMVISYASVVTDTIARTNSNAVYLQKNTTALATLPVNSYVNSSNYSNIFTYLVLFGETDYYPKQSYASYNNINSSAYASKIMVGINPGYLQEGVPYYSYDGHYFYTSYATMVSDYKQNIYSNSVNSSSPYYNYYQYLPHRSKTTFTASELDSMTSSMASGKLNGLGSDFIKYQNTYGTNAALVYSVAVLESGWGTSSIAQNKNNLFP